MATSAISRRTRLLRSSCRGPGSITELASINLKREAFEKWRTGYASAFAIILFATVVAAANVYGKALNAVRNR